MFAKLLNSYVQQRSIYKIPWGCRCDGLKSGMRKNPCSSLVAEAVAMEKANSGKRNKFSAPWIVPTKMVDSHPAGHSAAQKSAPLFSMVSETITAALSRLWTVIAFTPISEVKNLPIWWSVESSEVNLHTINGPGDDVSSPFIPFENFFVQVGSPFVLLWKRYGIKYDLNEKQKVRKMVQKQLVQRKAVIMRKTWRSRVEVEVVGCIIL